MSLLLRHLIELVLRIFFRRLEVVGLEHVPSSGPVLFVLNHPNALVDPLLLLTLAPRPVVFLAKEPLFRMPVIGHVVRAMHSVPVYRRIDAGADIGRNIEMFAQVSSVLDDGGAVALFPEGTSHSDSRLRPFKTGAARIALGVAAAGGRVQVVPAGLFYTEKASFRSAALLCFGQPIGVTSEQLGANGEPDESEVRQLTAELEGAMAEVTLQADRHEALALVTRAELIMTSGDAADGGRLPLADQFELRQRLVAGYGALRMSQPARLARLEHSITRLEARLAESGLDAERLGNGGVSARRVTRYAVRMTLYAILVLPVATLGIIIHYPAYRLIGPLVTTVIQASSDLVATVKILVAALLYPVTWAGTGWLVGTSAGPGWGVAAAVLAPGAGFVGLRFIERIDRFIGEARGLGLLVLRPGAFRALVAERERIRVEILALGAELARS